MADEEFHEWAIYFQLRDELEAQRWKNLYKALGARIV